MPRAPRKNSITTTTKPCDCCKCQDPVDCHGRATDIVIAYCNINAITDDAFDVKLNGTLIDHINYNKNLCTGSLWRSNSIIPVTGNWYSCNLCCPKLMNAATFDRSLVHVGVNTFDLINTFMNRQGNYGLLNIYGAYLADPIVNFWKPCDLFQPGFYSGGDGVSFHYSFTIPPGFPF